MTTEPSKGNGARGEGEESPRSDESPREESSREESHAVVAEPIVGGASDPMMM